MLTSVNAGAFFRRWREKRRKMKTEENFKDNKLAKKATTRINLFESLKKFEDFRKVPTIGVLFHRKYKHFT